ANPVSEGNPSLGRVVPAIGAAHVGARIHQTFLAGMKDDAGNESAAVDDDIAPGVGFGRQRPGWYRAVPAEQHKQDSTGDNSFARIHSNHSFRSLDIRRLAKG